MYGLVLEGGGAKGSYQIGACKALKEIGVEIGAVAGTSIGALNGALFVQDELEKAYEIWNDISISQLFDIEENRLEELRNMEISPDSILYFAKKAREVMHSRGLDITLVNRLLNDIIDENKLRNSKMKFGIVTISISDMKPLELFLEDIPEGKVVDYLLASANLPAFKQQKLDGKHFLDGGFYDNLPINMLIKKGYKDLIAIRTNAIGRTRRLVDSEAKVTYITSEQNLGRMLDFNKEQSRVNLLWGYFDTIKQFKGLVGRKYYIEPSGDEEFFVRVLTLPGEERILSVGEFLGFANMPWRRLLFEHIIPRLIVLLELKKDCKYEDIVVGVCEIIAEDKGLDKFMIYKFNSFLDEIRKKYVRKVFTSENRHLPAFLKQTEVLSRTSREKILREIIYELFDDFFAKPEFE
ncbi:MAG: patatin-like phospholipase family protein [Eubacteriales bacterium]